MVKEITTGIRQLVHVPVQSWKGWDFHPFSWLPGSPGVKWLVLYIMWPGCPNVSATCNFVFDTANSKCSNQHVICDWHITEWSQTDSNILYAWVFYNGDCVKSKALFLAFTLSSLSLLFCTTGWHCYAMGWCPGLPRYGHKVLTMSWWKSTAQKEMGEPCICSYSCHHGTRWARCDNNIPCKMLNWAITGNWTSSFPSILVYPHAQWVQVESQWW